MSSSHPCSARSQQILHVFAQFRAVSARSRFILVLGTTTKHLLMYNAIPYFSFSTPFQIGRTSRDLVKIVTRMLANEEKFTRAATATGRLGLRKITESGCRPAVSLTRQVAFAGASTRSIVAKDRPTSAAIDAVLAERRTRQQGATLATAARRAAAGSTARSAIVSACVSA